jgi:hypothetical protein
VHCTPAAVGGNAQRGAAMRRPHPISAPLAAQGPRERHCTQTLPPARTANAGRIDDRRDCGPAEAARMAKPPSIEPAQLKVRFSSLRAGCREQIVAVPA